MGTALKPLISRGPAAATTAGAGPSTSSTAFQPARKKQRISWPWFLVMLGLLYSLVTLHRMQQERLSSLYPGTQLLGMEEESSITGLTTFNAAPPIPLTARGAGGHQHRRKKVLHSPKGQSSLPGSGFAQTFDDLAEDQLLDEETAQQILTQALHESLSGGDTHTGLGVKKSAIQHHFFICTTTPNMRRLTGVIRGMLHRKGVAGPDASRFHIITSHERRQSVLSTVDRHFANSQVQVHVGSASLPSSNLKVSLPQEVSIGSKEFGECEQRPLDDSVSASDT